MSGQNVCCPEMLSGHIYKVNSSTAVLYSNILYSTLIYCTVL